MTFETPSSSAAAAAAATAGSSEGSELAQQQQQQQRQQQMTTFDLPKLLELGRLSEAQKADFTETTPIACATLAVCLYNVRYFEVRCELAGPDSPPPIARLGSIIDNESALHEGVYRMDEALLERTRWPIPIPREEFGMTIVMLYFAHFYAHQQYPIFVLTFASVVELTELEDTIYRFNAAHIQLPYCLSIDPQYSPLRLQYSGREHIGPDRFRALVALMCRKHLAVKDFIANMRPLLPMIVDSFYMLTSYSRESKAILECSLAKHGTLPYTFRGFSPASPDQRVLFWFDLPTGAVRFAYSQGKRALMSLADGTALTELLAEVPHSLVLGYICKGGGRQIGVLRIEPPDYTNAPKVACVWRHTIELAAALGLTCPLTDAPLPEKLTRIHFVTADSANIFKAKK